MYEVSVGGVGTGILKFQQSLLREREPANDEIAFTWSVVGARSRESAASADFWLHFQNKAKGVMARGAAVQFEYPKVAIMSNVFDVGQLVTELIPNVEKMKLYKMCFFSQGWHLAWTGRPLFEEKLLAWTEGPVPARLRREASAVARGWEIPYVPRGNSDDLSSYERAVVVSIVSFYGGLTSAALSQMSRGLAWREARHGLKDGERIENPMSVTTIREEFTNILRSAEAAPVAPPLPRGAGLMTFEEMLEVASEVESEWRETLALLSSR